MIIAIDGPAASGKGTIARALAKKYQFAYLDTGKLYRAVAAKARELQCPLDDIPALVAIATSITPADITNPQLQQDEVGILASAIAKIPEIRTSLFAFQRDFAYHPDTFIKDRPVHGSILDGRDIGTVICPEAELKFYLDATPEIRAQRRLQDLIKAGSNKDYHQVLQDIQKRDLQDQTRATAPLKIAEDAIYIDTSTLNVEEVVDRMAQYIKINTKITVELK